MIRQLLNQKNFKKSNTKTNRIEGFSDSVFAFAVALLLFSSQVPRTFQELKSGVSGIFSFALCFIFVIGIWTEHSKYFHRYNLNDRATRNLNAMLLLLFLFYIFPLKFVFSYQLETWIIAFKMKYLGYKLSEISQESVNFVQNAFKPGDNPSTLFQIFGLGWIGVFGTLFLMYRHAWKKRHQLNLNNKLVFETHFGLIENAWKLVPPVISILCSFSGKTLIFSGMAYLLYIPCVTLPLRHKRKRMSELRYDLSSL
jgi:hypothetical protein